VVEEISDKLNTVLEKVEAASDDEKMEILYNFLTGDAESYSKYFSQIIQIDTTTVFPVDNYGSACGVFYVVLALYVLALLLTSELKVDADVTGLKNVKSYETYFGRYLTFALIGLLQSVFLSAFCVWILKMQCEHVLAFFLVNAFISLVFTSITYSCVKTFGMIYGRTLATILVIFQMSTSGCTYSVEQIPTSMRWLNPYMPFTYCSNALREVCFGYTNYDLSIYLGKLLIFVAIALFFGLFVRIPMVKLIRFIDARLLDTGFMGVEEEAEEDEEDEDDEEDGDKEEYEEDEDENDRYEEMTDSKKEDEEDR
jgi:putative membrane protein